MGSAEVQGMLQGSGSVGGLKAHQGSHTQITNKQQTPPTAAYNLTSPTAMAQQTISKNTTGCSASDPLPPLNSGTVRGDRSAQQTQSREVLPTRSNSKSNLSRPRSPAAHSARRDNLDSLRGSGRIEANEGEREGAGSNGTPHSDSGTPPSSSQLFRRTLLQPLPSRSLLAPVTPWGQAYASFKRSVGLSPDAKLFVFSGNPNLANLQAIRDALEERGFIENVWEPTSLFFDFKWGSRQSVDYKALAPDQFVNHFQRDYQLTTKSGLALHIPEVSRHVNIDHDEFSPPAYHLHNADTVDSFEQEFKLSKAFGVLKTWLNHHESGARAQTFQEGVVRTALEVLKRRIKDVDEMLDGEDNAGEQLGFSVRPSEWDVLQEANLENPTAANAALDRQEQGRIARERIDRQSRYLVERRKGELQVQAERVKAEQAAAVESRSFLLRKRNPHRCKSTPALATGSLPRGRVSCEVLEAKADKFLDSEALDTEMEDWKKDRVADQLSGQALMVAVQDAIDAAKSVVPRSIHSSCRNVWIMKPAGKLRGQGIFLEDDLESILKHANRTKDDLVCSYVCQKYVESPLLVGGSRKHDIRQWVLVTSLNPLTIYFFTECYVRLTANEYTMDDISDVFTHLNNNAIISKHENYNPDDEYWRCQWDEDQYRSLLKTMFGRDVFVEKLLPAMKRIVIASMSCVQDALEEQCTLGSSFQLLGYDFLVDSDLGVWLLEVNSNPLMHASCPVTERLCDVALRDLVNVVLDGETARGRENHLPGSLRFELLHRGPVISKVKLDVSRELIVEGKQLHRPAPEFRSPEQEALSEEAKAEKLRNRQERREQELRELAERQRAKQQKEQDKKDRQLRLKRALFRKVLAKRAPFPGEEGDCHLSEAGADAADIASACQLSVIEDFALCKERGDIAGGTSPLYTHQ
mmetsp:Transcript_15445/g.27390  ORF Transcript_15445/g.27390 Transcript_15445/m.27390 type:complete len:921 (+) Transcript_15445:93-2855(+)